VSGAAGLRLLETVGDFGCLVFLAEIGACAALVQPSINRTNINPTPADPAIAPRCRTMHVIAFISKPLASIAANYTSSASRG
jgi:hypothetical protein